MKRTNLLVAAIVLLCGCFASCSDDEEVRNDLPLLEEGITDVTNGYNSFIIDLAKEYQGIPLYTKREVVFTHEKEDLVNFERKTIGDRDYLFPTLKKPIKAVGPFSVRVKIHIDGPTTKADGAPTDKEVMVSFRSSSSEPVPENMKYARIIGHGFDITQDPTQTKNYPIFDFNLIQEDLAKNALALQSAKFFETSGHRYEESITSWSANVGMSGVAPIPGSKGKGKMSGSVSYEREENSQTKKYFEYYLGYYAKEMAQTALNMDWVYETVKDSTGMGWAALLDSTVNNIFNNPNSDVYKMYANDTTSTNNIFTLLDRYGTHVITQGTFGGAYFMLFSREESSYLESVSQAASASISLKEASGGPGTVSNFAQVYAKKTGSTQINVSGGGSHYNAEYEEASKGYLFVASKGGDATTDMEAWDANVSTKTNENWVVVNFLTSGQSADSDPGLIPIYDLIGDPARRDAVKKYIGAYVDRKSVLPVVEEPILVADFMMKTGKDDLHKGEPAPFVAKDEFGIRRIYYPMMANDYFPDNKYKEYGAETSNDNFIVCDDKCDQYWYYALGHTEGRFQGILDVCFLEKSPSGFTARGDAADKSMTEGLIGFQIPSTKVQIRFAKDKTDSEKLIKGIGLRNKDSKKIFASTGGTEMRTPFATDTRFSSYWTGWTEYRTSNNKMTHWYDGVDGLKVENLFYPVYSTKELDVDFKSAADKINQPKPW